MEKTRFDLVISTKLKNQIVKTAKKEGCSMTELIKNILCKSLAVKA